jgi:hypothetical protein
MLSKIKRADEQGKIYGLMDLMDTVALLITIKYIKDTELISYNNVFGVSLTILLVSSIIIFYFIFYIKNMRGNDKPGPEKSKRDQ